MKFKKILCLALALLTVVAIAAACGDDEDKKGGNYSLTEDDMSFLSHIEQEDMEGYEFRILTRKNQLKSQFVEEETGEIIDDAVYRRNETVKAFLNIDIIGTEGTDDSGNDALNSILAGDDQFDAIFPHSRTAFNYVAQDTVLNVNEIETIDLTQDWWSKDIINSCEIQGNLYVLDGDISTDGIAKAATMYFNKRIFDELGLPYPYQLVLDGEWTFDEFSKLVKKGSKDLSGDGLMDKDVDQFGFYTRDWFSPIYILYSGGQRIYTKNAQGIPRLTLNSPKTVQIYSDFFNLVKTKDVYIGLALVDEPKTDLFTDGRAMFADRALENAQSMRGMNDEFGILPFPKYSDEEQDYITIVNGAASLLVIPTTVSDANRTGKIIEALCAIGSRDVVPAYYDVSLKTKFARDVESEDMVDIIKSTRIYDLGYISGGEFQSTGRDLAHQNNPDFSSYYAARESAAQSDLEIFIESYIK